MQCLSPIRIKNPKLKFNPAIDSEYLVVPCGKCFACKSRYKMSWANRLIEHGRDLPTKFFCDLTYNDEFLPVYKKNDDKLYRLPELNDSLDSDCYPTLLKSDVQKWLKRFRKSFPFPFSYFLVGEYGEFYSRPHYHFLLFVEKPDLILKHDDFIPFLSETWCKKKRRNKQTYIYPFGFSSVYPVTDRDIRYTCKYQLKQQLPDYFPEYVQKPFMICSNNIGACYLEKPDNVDFHKGLDRLYYPLDNGTKSYLPRYWKEQLYSKLELREYAEICNDKAMRKNPIDDMMFRHQAMMIVHKAEKNDHLRKINSVKFSFKR